MSDYISREAAIKKFEDAEYLYDPEPGAKRYTVEDAKEILNDVPAAAVRPVKEGRWIKARGNWCSPGGDPVWECSECGKGVHVYGIEHGTYGSDIADGQWVSCPNCGAMMGGTP